MRILHHTFRIVLDFYAKVIGVFLVPNLWQLVDCDFVGEEVSFKLKADDDVQAVGDFVGFNADFRAFNPVYGLNKRV